MVARGASASMRKVLETVVKTVNPTQARDIFEPPEDVEDGEVDDGKAEWGKGGMGEGMWGGDFGYLDDGEVAPKKVDGEGGRGGRWGGYAGDDDDDDDDDEGRSGDDGGGHITVTAGWVLYDLDSEEDSWLYRVTCRVPFVLARQVTHSGIREGGAVERLELEQLKYVPIDPDEPWE